MYRCILRTNNAHRQLSLGAVVSILHAGYRPVPGSKGKTRDAVHENLSSLPHGENWVRQQVSSYRQLRTSTFKNHH